MNSADQLDKEIDATFKARQLVKRQQFEALYAEWLRVRAESSE